MRTNLSQLDNDLEKFLEKTTPSKDFATRLAFELDDMEHSLLATVVGKTRDFELAKRVVRNYLEEHAEEEISKDLTPLFKKELMAARKRAEELIQQARHRSDSKFLEEIKEFFEGWITASESPILREISLDSFKKATNWYSDALESLFDFLSEVNDKLRNGEYEVALDGNDEEI